MAVELFFREALFASLKKAGTYSTTRSFYGGARPKELKIDEFNN